jgi:serine/threonine protein kinase/tetratricopeptide (TPR) repeat protein
MSEPTPLEAIFFAALEKAPGERPAYLAEACGGDDALRRRVQRMLAAQVAAGSFLESPVAGGGPEATLDSPPEHLGTQIGPYKLLEQIGEGGMGTVWMAQQSEPVRRLVAVKLIKAGMDSRQVIARFEAERQALALMDHPNIAKVLDAGEVGQVFNLPHEGRQVTNLPHSGRPYFVMELVRGVPITQYCDEHRLTPRQRLELFIPVCQAIQHAHQKGIIHRDLKPTNILVAEYDNQPVPKVIDFGVAKAIGQSLTEKTMFTGFGQLVGTLEYMSPEQAKLNQLDIDTRSDIYSLGVLIYELLTGSTPFDQARLRTLPFDETLRIIREEDPERPSTRISKRRSAERGMRSDGKPNNGSAIPHSAIHIPQLQELDWIVMKALEKDRARRYDTAGDLALDVERYLADEPVQACPPSAAYRLRKMIRRNVRVLAVAVVVTLAMLVAFGAVVGSIGWMAGDRAARRREVERGAVLALGDAAEAIQRKQWTVARLATARADGLLAGAADCYELQQQTRTLLADLEMVAALEEIRLRQTERWFDVAKADAAYAAAFQRYGPNVEALSASEAARAIRARSVPLELAAALDDWAYVRRYHSSRDAAAWKHVLAIARLADPDSLRGQVRDAWERSDRHALMELSAVNGVKDLPPQTIVLLATGLYRLDAKEQAAALLRRTQPHHVGDFWINEHLGLFLTELQPPRYEEAVRFLTAAAALRPQSPAAQGNVGYVLCELGLFAEGLTAYENSVRLFPEDAANHHTFGFLLSRAGIHDRAIAELREALRLNPDYPGARWNLAYALSRQGDWPAAIEVYERLRQQPADRARAANSLAWLLATCPEVNYRDAARAVELAKDAVEQAPLDGNYWNTLGVAQYRAGNFQAAVEALEKAEELDPDKQLAINGFFLAMAQWQLANQDQARQWYDRAVAWMETKHDQKTNTSEWQEELRRFRSEADEVLRLNKQND